MKIHVLKPYALDKNLGRAYNEAMELIPDGDWACLMDYDTMFLTSDAIALMYKYVESYPEAGMFTSYTNRIHPLSDVQLLGGHINEDNNIAIHLHIARELADQPINVTPINKVVSGFLMLVSKDNWDMVKFSEDKKCLGVDNDFCTRLMNTRTNLHPYGKQIYRMDTIYVWHTYRIMNGINDKSHLI